MKASVDIASTVLLGLGSRFQINNYIEKQRKWSKAKRNKNGEMIRSNPTSAIRYTKNKMHEL